MDEQAWYSLTENEKHKYAEQLYNPKYRYYRSFWTLQSDIDEVHKNFFLYVEKMLFEGKKVILSDHAGAISDRNLQVRVYNALCERYPNQLYFLWGHEGKNRLTCNTPIEPKDTDPDQATDIWDVFSNAEGGLSRCSLPKE
jgi:hypothetical protein